MPDFVLYALIATIPTVVLAAFGYMYFGGRRRSAQELAQPVEHEARCGGQFDRFNLSMPFVRHSLYRDFVVFAYGGTNIRLDYKDLVSVAETRYVLARKFDYRHKRQDAPKRIVVSTWSGEQVLQTLRNKGVSIEYAG